MKQITLSFVALLVTAFSFAQTKTIKPDEAAQHIGDSLSVCGKVFGGKFFESGKNQPTLINMGAAFPKSTFTVVVYGEMRTKLGYAPEEKWTDKEVCITGKIIEFKGKPQIIITSEDQIKVKE